MRKVDLSFSQGEPLPASKVNALVGSTAEISEGATYEHSPEGAHINPRFETACALIAFDASKNEWGFVFQDRFESVQTGGGGQRALLTLSDEVGDPVHPFYSIGVIAYDHSGMEIPYRVSSGRVQVAPPSGTTEVFVTVLMLRSRVSLPDGIQPSNALWHNLQEGGVGEVVSAEMLQGVVDVQHAAVDSLLEDHRLDWRGLPEHNDLRWAKAVALLEILPLDDTRPVDEVPTRLHFSVGFSEPPKVVGGRRQISFPGNPVQGWFVDWKISQVGPQAAAVGWGVRSLNTPLLDTPRFLDHGPWAGGHSGEYMRVDDEGRASYFLGQYDYETVGEDQVRVVSAHLRNIQFLTLMIR